MGKVLAEFIDLNRWSNIEIVGINFGFYYLGVKREVGNLRIFFSFFT